MLRFTKAHAYGNDFLYVSSGDLSSTMPLDELARELCHRQTGVGADGLIVYEVTTDGASMRLFNADGGRAEVSGNGVRALAALLLRNDDRPGLDVVVRTEGGIKRLVRTGRDRSRQTFRADMGLPAELRLMRAVSAGGEVFDLAVMNFGNPQCVVLGPLPDEDRFRRLGPALERHSLFPEGSNVEFAHIDAPDRVRILIWERGVGATLSSGTGSCAALIAAAAFGGAARSADVAAPGGTQRVEWRDEGVYLTGWAEVLFDGVWLRPASA